jgi:hypothetical protein
MIYILDNQAFVPSPYSGLSEIEAATVCTIRNHSIKATWAIRLCRLLRFCANTHIGKHLYNLRISSTPALTDSDACNGRFLTKGILKKH